MTDAYVHVPVLKRSVQDTPFAQQGLDATHVDLSGGCVNEWGAVYASEDGLLEVGYQRFSGAMQLGPADDRENVMVILSGSGELRWGDRHVSFAAGDTLVLDWPGSSVTLESPGLQAVYVTRFRSEETRAKSRPQA